MEKFDRAAYSSALQKALVKKYNAQKGAVLYSKYCENLSDHYLISFTFSEVISDIEMLESIVDAESPKFYVYELPNDKKNIAHIKIFLSTQGINISQILKMVENYGFQGEEMSVHSIEINNEGVKGRVYIYYISLVYGLEISNVNSSLKVKDIGLLQQQSASQGSLSNEVKENVSFSLAEMYLGNFDDDTFNALILKCNFTWLEVLIMRGYGAYLKQVKFAYDMEYIAHVLLIYPVITKKIVEFFLHKFAVADVKGMTQEAINEVKSSILLLLNDVEDISHDTVLRTYLELICATKRTNYKNLLDNKEKYEDKALKLKGGSLLSNSIVFKIASGELSSIPLPKPQAEFYVYSAHFEGILLKGGKIARGGLRWSDRFNDFRTEILALMKAQMTKNSVIVPVGSKGGFIVKNDLIEGKADLKRKGIECYKAFLGSLLTLSDNIDRKSDQLVKPKNVICYDGDEPYLVVAADKGTAMFSDFANEVSNGCNFWLKDAFASGGSNGYDHKKMGITAKGAWVSVALHFKQLNKDIRNHSFTAVGIGDMSGDVFGNGMLLSDKMKLVAAFNHRHIFIDPEPVPEVSYNERKRLFDMPGSQWSDYDKNLISQGGGVFDRKVKSIKITKEILNVLDIDGSVLSMTPDDLIKAILKAPVDLMWNGGIGTYVKAKYESHEFVSDKANDAVRVNGEELRCKVVGEGGNLGFTQRARVEYSKAGGRINTDFIDNSAGVDCSDHEVNIKIALDDAIQKGQISSDDRNRLLSKMELDVEGLVLEDNYKQVQLISVEEYFREINFNKNVWLIKYLESRGELDRAMEFLPDSAEIKNLEISGKSFTRPEIAVLVAYAKNSMSKMLEGVDFTNDHYFIECLLHYFPSAMRESYNSSIMSHQLKNDIIRTFLVNDFINVMGISTFHQIFDLLNVDPIQILKTFIIAKEGLGIGTYWRKVEKMDIQTLPFSIKMKLLMALRRMIEKNIYWLIQTWHSRNCSSIDLMGMVRNLRQRSKEILEAYNCKMITNVPTISNIAVALNDIGLPNSVAEKVKKLPILANLIEISFIVDDTGFDLVDVAKVYYGISEKLKIQYLYNKIGSRVMKDNYGQLAVRLTAQDISIMLNELIGDFIIRGKCRCDFELFESIYGAKKLKDYSDFIESLETESIERSLISLLVILKRKIKSFTVGIGIK